MIVFWPAIWCLFAESTQHPPNDINTNHFGGIHDFWCAATSSWRRQRRWRCQQVRACVWEILFASRDCFPPRNSFTVHHLAFLLMRAYTRAHARSTHTTSSTALSTQYFADFLHRECLHCATIQIYLTHTYSYMPFVCFMEKDKWSDFVFRSHRLRVAAYDVSHRHKHVGIQSSM